MRIGFGNRKPVISCRYTLGLYSATILQIFSILILLWLTRFIFAWYNSDLMGEISIGSLLRLAVYGLPFDVSAVAYFNILFILLRFIPFDFVRGRGYTIATAIIFGITNSIMFIFQLGDIPFFRFSGARMRFNSFVNLWTDSNMVAIVFSYFKQYWWTFLLVFLMLILIWWIAFIYRPWKNPQHYRKAGRKWIITRVAAFLVAGLLTFIGMRGSVTSGRPLAIGDAIWGVNDPREMNVVLNTPFTILRSLKGDTDIPDYKFFSPAKLSEIRNSLHKNNSSKVFSSGKNIMTIVLESGTGLWLDSVSMNNDRSRLRLMPFLDSISSQSVVFHHSMSSGVRSIEGITSLLGGFPTFGSMLFMSSKYNTVGVDAPAILLADEGWQTKFYFGGNPGSYSIDQLLNRMGYRDVTNRLDYGDDTQFDGKWGIYDHAMAEYVAEDLSKLPQPFMAGWFTLNPHEPFSIPADWDNYKYKGSSDMERAVEYSDRALRHFFEIARTQPWFENTVFVITGDHGSREFASHDDDSPYVKNHIVMMVYDPSQELKPRIIRDRVVSQFDLAPTLLYLAGYDKPYVALGINMLDGSDDGGFAVSYNNDMFVVSGLNYIVTLSPDMKNIIAVYDARKDKYMKNPVSQSHWTAEVDSLVLKGRAFMQDYSSRMNGNKMSIRNQAPE